MNSERQQNFLLRKEKILAMAEKLLLDNNQDITLEELASELDIAKGTIYKHFDSKNQLYLELIILNEKRLLDISHKFNTDINSYVSEYMLYNMLNSNRTILLHVIEERLTNTYGACLLLNSTHYQKAIGSRDRLIKLYINQVLMTPDKVV